MLDRLSPKATRPPFDIGFDFCLSTPIPVLTTSTYVLLGFSLVSPTPFCYVFILYTPSPKELLRVSNQNTSMEYLALATALRGSLGV